MKKIVVGDYELQAEGLIMGAVVATGIGLIGLSIKNLLDARKLKYASEQPIDDDLEFEEYKEEKVRKIKKKRDAKLRRGIIGVSIGAFATAVGVAAFTPLRKYVVNDDFTLRDDRAEQLGGVVSSVRELSGNIQDGIQNRVQTVRSIDLGEIRSNIPSVNDIKSNIPNVNEIKSSIPCPKCFKCAKCVKAPDISDLKANIENIKALIVKVQRIKAVSEKLESKLSEILAKLS